MYSAPMDVEISGVQEGEQLPPRDKENTDCFIEFGGAARNVGLKSLFQRIFGLKILIWVFLGTL